MLFRNIFRIFSSLAITVMIILATASTNFTEERSDCDIVLFIPDTTTPPHTEITIPVYFDNFEDTLLGFAIWIWSDRPANVLTFKLDTAYVFDTLYWDCLAYNGPDCIDSVSVSVIEPWDFIHVDSNMTVVGLLDTTGTLVSGWEYVESRSILGNGTDLIIVGVANLSGATITPGFPPQQGGTLIEFTAQVFDDTEPLTDSTVILSIYTEFSNNFSLVFQDGLWNPWLETPVEDTSCFVCTEWDIDTTQSPPDSVCLNWQQSAFPPCDSIAVTVDTIYILDTNIACVYDGSVRIIAPPVCGDFNGDGVGGNILDLTFIVNCLFRNMCPGELPAPGDINCDGSVNILDLILLVNYIFRNGPPPCSSPGC